MLKQPLKIRSVGFFLFSLSVPFSTVQAEISVAQSTSLASQLFQVFGALLFIIVLILGAAWLAKNLKINGGVSGQKITALSVLPLGRKEKVVLIESCGEKILLGVTANAVNTIHVFDEKKKKDVVEDIKAVGAEREELKKSVGQDSEDAIIDDDLKTKATVEFSNFLKAVMSGKKNEN